MKLPQGCCCWDQRQGTMAVGIFTLVLGILGLLSEMTSLAAQDSFTSPHQLTDNDDGVVRVEDGFQRTYYTRSADTAVGVVDAVYYGVRGGLIASLVMTSLYVVVCSLLIHGVRVTNHYLFIPWMVATSLQVASALVGLIVALVLTEGHLLAVVGFIIGLLVLGFMVYMLLAVISYYVRLDQVRKYGTMGTSENELTQAEA